MTDEGHSVRLTSGSASLVGKVRAGNEDSFFVSPDLLVVADGMGGHLAGEVASAEAVQVLAGVAGRRSLIDLVSSVHLANRRINERAADDPDLRGMGTTVCAVGLVDQDGERLAVINVGDSRVYLFADDELRQLTDDHSLVETLVREGRITEAEAEVHPQRNVLTRALGVEALVLVDAWLLQPRDGDRLLLCSDGLFNEVNNDRIAEILADGDTPEIAARRLAAEAEANGGRDNITTVVIDVSDTGEPAAPYGDRYRRIATPTVDLDDLDRDGFAATATVPLVSIVPAPGRGDDDEEEYEGDFDSEDNEDGGASDASDADVHPDSNASTPADADGNSSTNQRAGASPGSSESGSSDAELVDADSPDRQTDTDESPSQRTWRTPVFILAVLLLIGGAIGLVVYGSRGGWFVRSDNEVVVLYKGRPQTIFWITPRAVERLDDIPVDRLRQSQQLELEQGKTFDSRRGAENYISELQRTANPPPTTTTSTTTTTTTTPPTTVAPTTVAPPAPIDPAPTTPPAPGN